MCTAVAAAFVVQRNDLAHGLVDRGLQRSQLIISERVANHHESVAMKYSHGPLHFRRFKNLQSLDPIVSLEVSS